ncbi:MAG: hypothetical protein FWG75_05255 [Cystobacterineae bacterium]|nr:hypothetical protein [Cystobacterineae bacterium]
MFRFSIGKIPVEVSTSHVVFSLVLAFLFAEYNLNFVIAFLFPSYGLEIPLPPLPVAIACWLAVISFSVLVHELGHAWSSLAFGNKPSIVLAGMGGYTLTPVEKPLPWLKEVVLTLAGPLAGYVLAGLSGFLFFLLRDNNPSIIHYICIGFSWANLLWSTFNLLPIGPLDGGRIAGLFFMRFAPQRAPLYTQVLGLLCGIPILAWALLSRSLFMAIFVGFFVLRSLMFIVEFLRNKAPSAEASAAEASAEAPAEAASEELVRIKKLLEEGAYAEGLQQAENLLASALPPEESAQAHYWAGWLAIKSNQGRKALNHFSQAEGLEVPPQAMAAAFSLLGEDERALHYWEMANLLSENPTLLHEWAGTLLRLGKVSQVREMPNIRLSKAYLCAESVFRLRREYAQAAQAGEAAFNLEPEAELAYEAACNYALAEDDSNALRMLVLAAQNGFSNPQKALTDTALFRLHHNPEFQQWLSGLRWGLLN